MVEPSINKNLSTERESIGSYHYLSNKKDSKVNTNFDSFLKINTRSTKQASWILN